MKKNYNFETISIPPSAGIAQSVWRLATGGTVRGSNPGGCEIFRARPERPWAHPASYTMVTGSFPGVKRPGRGVDHPPPYSAEVKERVELYLSSPSGPSWPVVGWPAGLTPVTGVAAVYFSPFPAVRSQIPLPCTSRVTIGTCSSEGTVPHVNDSVPRERRNVACCSSRPPCWGCGDTWHADVPFGREAEGRWIERMKWWGRQRHWVIFGK
jgi:hypothetical protein